MLEDGMVALIVAAALVGGGGSVGSAAVGARSNCRGRIGERNRAWRGQ